MTGLVFDVQFEYLDKGKIITCHQNNESVLLAYEVPYLLWSLSID